MKQEELTEIFEYLPKGTELYGYVSEYPIYSNDTIVSTSLDWIRKSHITKPIINKIEEGLKTKRIMVGYTEPGVFKFFFRRLFSKMKNVGILHPDFFISGTEDTLGFFSKTTNTLAIVLDPSKVDIFGKVLTNVPSILTHELCHMAACSDTYKYLNIMRDPLIEFYMLWVQKVLEYNKVDYDTKKLNKSNIKKLVDDLTIYYEGGDDYKTDKGTEVWLNTFKIFTADRNELKKCVRSVGNPFYFFMLGETNIDGKSELLDHLKIIARTYRDAGIKGILGVTTPCQEFLFTSEVVCVSNQFKLSPEAIKLIKSINMG